MEITVSEIPARRPRFDNREIVRLLLDNPGKSVVVTPCGLPRIRAIRVSFKRHSEDTLNQMKQGDGYVLWASPGA